jgi:hypothetical protein
VSGAKTISVDRGAWNRAQSSARELATVRREMPRMLDNVRRQSQADTRRMVAPIARRQAATERRLKRLSDHTRRLEQETDARLRDQAAQIHGVREEARREARRLDREIRQERAERRRQIDDLVERRERASALTRAFLADSRVMAEEISTLPHERFAPGRLAVLEGRLAGTTQTAAEVDAAYALGSAQDLYYDLSDLRLEVQQAEQEWLAARREALETLRRADARIEQFAKTPMLDENGAEIPDVVLDLDFWTDGCLTTLRDEVRRDTEALADDGCPLSVEELREVIQKHAPAYEQRLDELLERGATRMYASQERYNVAEKIADALGAEGYDLVKDVYEGDDHRWSHFTRLRHLAGEGDIVVEVAPEGDTGMSIKLLSYDTDPAESRRVERAANMLAKLREEGVPVGAPVDRGTEPTPEEADFDLIQKRRQHVG